jgi:hypothetical protein
MKPAELLRRINRFATRHGLPIEVSEGGNHTKVRLNGLGTVIPRHAHDMKTGTFRGILKQIGLSPNDLED